MIVERQKDELIRRLRAERDLLHKQHAQAQELDLRKQSVESRIIEASRKEQHCGEGFRRAREKSERQKSELEMELEQLRSALREKALVQKELTLEEDNLKEVMARKAEQLEYTNNHLSCLRFDREQLKEEAQRLRDGLESLQNDKLSRLAILAQLQSKRKEQLDLCERLGQAILMKQDCFQESTLQIKNLRAKNEEAEKRIMFEIAEQQLKVAHSLQKNSVMLKQLQDQIRSAEADLLRFKKNSVNMRKNLEGSLVEKNQYHNCCESVEGSSRKIEKELCLHQREIEHYKEQNGRLQALNTRLCAEYDLCLGQLEQIKAINGRLAEGLRNLFAEDRSLSEYFQDKEKRAMESALYR